MMAPDDISTLGQKIRTTQLRVVRTYDEVIVSDIYDDIVFEGFLVRFDEFGEFLAMTLLWNPEEW